MVDLLGGGPMAQPASHVADYQRVTMVERVNERGPVGLRSDVSQLNSTATDHFGAGQRCYAVQLKVSFPGNKIGHFSEMSRVS